jgi:hypothetical protein
MSEIETNRWTVVVGHPGHELRAFHFCERTRPCLAVLTDGSGSQGVPRIAETTRLAADIGARPVAVFGQFTDKDAYSLLQSGDATPLREVVDALARDFLAHGTTAVLTDAAEGYNPVHDLCRALTEAAVRRCGRPIELFELDLAGSPAGSGDGIRLELDDAAFGRKLAAVERYGPLAAEAAAAFDQYGLGAFRIEFLRRAQPLTLAPADYVPYYEQVGLERVRQGRYATVLRYGTHVRPIIEAILSESVQPVDALTYHPLH